MHCEEWFAVVTIEKLDWEAAFVLFFGKSLDTEGLTGSASSMELLLFPWKSELFQTGVAFFGLRS